MELGEALYRAICGRQSRTEISGLGKGLNWLLGRSGSKAEAARALGVPRSTFTRWLAGAKPRGQRGDDTFKTLLKMQRRARLTPRRERKLRAAPARDTMITGSYRYDQDHREVRIGIYLDPSTINQLVDAFLDGASTEQLAEIFHENILDDGFYERTFDPHNEDPDDSWDVKEVWGWG